MKKGKLKENLEQFKDQAFMSKNLGTILLHAPVDFDENKLVWFCKPKDLLQIFILITSFITFSLSNNISNIDGT